MKSEHQVDACATWYVFETFVADGTLAIGVAQGTPDPSTVMIVREGLTRGVAYEAAAHLAKRHRDHGVPLPHVEHDG